MSEVVVGFGWLSFAAEARMSVSLSAADLAADFRHFLGFCDYFPDFAQRCVCG